MKIYVFGNQTLKEDGYALEVSRRLRQIFSNVEFVISDPNENFPPDKEKELVILDTVLGLDKPTLFNFEDLESIKKSPVSPHDYDLLMHLLLLKKLNKINKVVIIGIPQKKADGAIITGVEMIIQKLIST